MNATPKFNQERSDAIEQLLSDTVEATRMARPMRRPSRRLIVASIAAFALAGGLTGGAVASAATVSAQQAATEAAVQGAGQEAIAESDGTQLGQAITRSGSSTLIIQLGTAPAGANWIEDSFQCLDRAKFEESVDGKDVGGDDCTSFIGDPGASADPFTGTGTHTFTVNDPDHARFTVWLAWAKFPTLVASAEENAETADGFVTRAEDLAAYERYGVCMTTLGYPIADESDMESGILPLTNVSTEANASGADNRCYVTQYRDVDQMWQNEVNAGRIAVASIETCLRDENVDPAGTPAARLKQLAALGIGWQDGCTWVG
jgi:hypothetical protein